MSGPIVVTIHADEAEGRAPLRRQVWEFLLFEGMGTSPLLVLDRYAVEVRETPRKRWRIEAIQAHGYAEKRRVYLRLETERRLYGGLQESEVPLPPDVVAMAKAALMERIVVCKWGDR